MSRKKAIILSVLAMLATYGAANAFPKYDLYDDIHRTEIKQRKEQEQQQQQQQQQQQAPQQTEETKAPEVIIPKTAKDFYSFVPLKDLYVKTIDNKVYYSNPTIKSAIARYKQGNYTGSLQELYAYIKIQPNNPYAYYCMALAYTRLGQTEAARNCYQKVINCNAQGKLFELALKGRDCISGGMYCMTPVNPLPEPPKADEILKAVDPLDQFINAPYTGHGFSPELEREYQQKQLDTIQKTINRKENLNKDDIEDLKQIQREHKSEVPMFEKIAMAASISSEPTNEEVLDAIDVLKRAGLNISADAKSVSSNSENAADTVKSSNVNPASFVNPEYEAINMMMGNNNNNNNDPMMSMLPYMLSNNENGKNVDPQVIQAVMMNSMMSSLNSLNSTDNK
ncbi:MAG: tetratricopeptide repeat protein [Candidatus Gastranaerophilaceae bacterium]|nr:tetratricopeptide repeat protein [Candidatus Gastranaerophilaceae bacterium]